MIFHFFGSSDVIYPLNLVNTETQIGVEPFLLNKKKMSLSASQFAFDAATTKSNLHRLLRAY